MWLKPSSQYDAGVMSVVSVTEKKVFFTSQIACLTLNLLGKSDWLDAG